MTAADKVGIVQSDGTLLWTTINTASGTSLTTVGTLTASALAGAYVYWYTNKAQRFPVCEYANLRKKVERGDFTIEQARPELADELADVVIYLDILASQLGIDLGKAVMAKWNRTSLKVGAPIYIDAEDWHYSHPVPK